jgi:hypothetical protein
MKVKRPPIHLITVSEPLLCFHQLEMKCGTLIENGLMCFGLQLDFRADLSGPTRDKLCEICRAQTGKPPAAHEIPMYEYGLVEKKRWQEWLEARGENLDIDPAEAA